MIQTMANPKAPGWTLKGWHVLAVLVVFFGTMFAANGVFLYYALTTFSGIETQDAYRKGVAYNQSLEEERRYDSLGWQAKIVAKGEKLELTLLSEDGTPLRGKKVFGNIGRPSTEKYDQSISFKDAGDGLYVVENANLAPGNWVVSLEIHEPVSADTTPRFRLKERLWLSQ